MIPRRIVSRRHLPIYVMSVVVLCALLLSAWALRERSSQLDQVIFDQCVANEQQDTVIVSILLSIPPQRRPPVVQDAINALEPVDEQECQPPKGSQP